MRRSQRYNCNRKLKKMKKIFPALLVLAFSCQEKPKVDKKITMSQRIDSLESRLALEISDEIPENEAGTAMYLARDYQLFASDYPSDTNASSYLVRCAQVIQYNLNDRLRANELYLDVMNKYPKAKSAALANFLLANNFHDSSDSLNAARYLDLFLDKYPNHELVPAARDLKKYVEMPAAVKKKTFGNPVTPGS